MLNRFLLSLGFLFLGLNFIWFGCKENGSDNRHNPVWELVDGFVQIEKGIVLIAFGIAVVIGVIMAITSILNSIQFKRNPEEKYRARFIQEKRESSLPFIREQVKAVQVTTPALREKPPCESVVVPEKQKPSPEALKQKAIQDILRR